MSRILKIAAIGYLVIAVAGLVILPFLFTPSALAQGWQPPPDCELQMLYNNDFDQGHLGWEWGHLFWHHFTGFGVSHLPYPISDPFYGAALHVGDTLKQPIDLPPGKYHLALGMSLHSQCPLPAGVELEFINILDWMDYIKVLLGDIIPWCGDTCDTDWDGIHWGTMHISIGDRLITEHTIPDYSLYYYYTFEYDFYLPEGAEGNFTIRHWSPCWCAPCVVDATRIDLDWVSLCRVSPDTPTPTVTGTPPNTPTPTATPTVFCESTDYPTATPYPTSTPYPTNTPWQTPPMFFTPTPYPTYTPWPTCVATWTPTPYTPPTPFRFNVPLTYTNNFDDLKDGVEDFVDSTTGLVDDVSGMLITASNAVADVTDFAITDTVVISGTPTASSDLVTTFTDNLSGLSYLFGWLQWFRTLNPTAYWFLFACLAWTFIIKGLKFALSFFLNVLWPLAKTIWEVIVDLWNSIPFI